VRSQAAPAFRREILCAASLLLAAAGCSREPAKNPAPASERPSILLITLDTTRADAIGRVAMARGLDTDAFSALEGKGRRFTHAYATVPETLPSHTSMMTGLYPGGHGIHQNARYVDAKTPLLAEQLQRAGYRTAAFVSAFVLNRRFGLARGFDRYDDEFFGGRDERNALETTDAAIQELRAPSSRPRFLWVHYYDPHAPYRAPDSRPGGSLWNRYLGEIRFMDVQMARLFGAFYEAAGPLHAAIVVGDHGEALGEHGEAEHGRLLYEATMRVPLVIVGPGIGAGGVSTTPVSTRRVYHTILDWAGLGSEHSLRGPDEDVVLAEGMGPFLQNGWQPQVMAVSGRYKAILSGRLETYDLQADPTESHDLGSGVAIPTGMRKAMEDYPVPSPDVARAPANLDEDAKRRLAALGYVSAGAAPAVRKDAPRPADMATLFATMDEASALFGAAQYARAIPVLQKILAADPRNLDAALRLASSYSSLGRNADAEAAFRKAAAIAPDSQDVRTYLALHYARTHDWPRAVPLLEQVVQESPDRATAVEALGGLKVREGLAAMERGDTPAAIAAFERARQLRGVAFRNDLDLGVLYLDARRFEDARAALDRALAAKPDDPMALFKRAQVSVLLNEPDSNARIDLARRKADQATRALIEHEKLFR
jgi:arylsulfatase A-like enzyme/tetratricopeptide (TPR) repeat protein